MLSHHASYINPSQSSCNWLAEPGLETWRGVTVKITDRCLTIIADNTDMQEMHEQLYQAKQVVKGIKNGIFSVLNES